jgi:cytoskeleton protein RodZ
MTETDNTNENQTAPSTEPGATLARVREQLGMTVEQVADKLHLSQRQIDALENNRYEDLPEAPYVRGYIRNYALLLEIDEQPLVEAFNSIQDKVRKVAEIKQSTQTVTNDRKRDDTMIKVAGIGAVAVLVIVLLVSIYSGDDKQIETVQSDLKETGMAAPETDFPVQLDGVDGIVTDGQMPEEGAKAAITDDPSSIPSESITAESSATDTATGNATSQEQGMMPAVPDTAVNPETDTTLPDDKAVSQLVLYVEADSWADVRDSSDRKLVYETIPGGRVVTLEGQPPFKVFIGNAKAVKLFYNGREFDISPHYRGLVARFTLN